MVMLLPNFKPSTFYKFLIYFGGTLLISSFFFEVKSFDVNSLRFKSMIVIITGLAIWVLNDIIRPISDLTYRKHIADTTAEKDYLEEIERKQIRAWIVAIIILITGSILVFI